MINIQVNETKDTKPKINRYPYIGKYKEQNQNFFVYFVKANCGFELNSSEPVCDAVRWSECKFTPIKSITIESHVDIDPRFDNVDNHCDQDCNNNCNRCEKMNSILK